MSRIANYPVNLPAGVEVKIDRSMLTIKGQLGQLSQAILADVNVAEIEKTLTFVPAGKSSTADMNAGTMRALANNMVQGVSKGFERKLIMKGVGYRAKAQGDMLSLTAGFSHPVDIKMPQGVVVETPTQTDIVLKGADKQKVCQVAANIRAVRPPEPYKGKGIRYHDEVVQLKEGKKK